MNTENTNPTETTATPTKRQGKPRKQGKKTAKASSRKGASRVAKASTKRGTPESYARTPEVWGSRLRTQTEELASKWEHFGRHAGKHGDPKAAKQGAAVAKKIRSSIPN